MRTKEIRTIRTVAAVLASALGGVSLAGCGGWMSDDQVANAPGLYGQDMPASITPADVDMREVEEGHLSFVRDGIAKLDMFLSPGDKDPKCGIIKFEKTPGSKELVQVDGSFEDWPIVNSPYERGGSCNFKDDAIAGNPEGALEQIDKLVSGAGPDVSAEAEY